MLLEILREALCDDGLHQSAHLGVAELGLGLALELRIPQLDRDDRGQALSDVLAGEVLVLLLENPLPAGVLVDGPGQRVLESVEVGPALVGVDVVGEGEHGVGVAGVPLHRDLDRPLGALGLEVDRPRVDGLFVSR